MKCKKIFLTAVVLVAVILGIGVGVSAAEVVESGSCGENVTYTLNNDGVLNICGSGAMNSYSFRSDNRPPWYSNKGQIKEVVVEQGVTGVGKYAFYVCTNLKKATIAGSVTYISTGAFNNCTSLVDVVLSTGLKSIGEQAFFHCTALKNIVIPDSVKNIYARAFENCTYLETVTLLNRNISLSGCFSDCDSLTDIYFAGSKTEWDLLGFSGDGIEIHFADKAVKYSGEYNNITWKLYDNGTLELSGTGSICDSENSVSPWNSYRSEITEININNGITDIGDSAFRSLDLLKKVNISESVVSIGERAFYECSSLTDIAIPESVTLIGGYAFYECSSLTDLTIPKSIISIGYNAFEGTGIYMNNNNWDNYALYVDGWLIRYRYQEKRGEYEIKDGCVGIAGGAFASLSNVTGVVFPKSVKYISECAFNNCRDLISITIPKSVVHFETKECFGFCDDLVSVKFENNLTEIGDSMFYYCQNLTDIYIPTSVTKMEKWAFGCCFNLKKIVIPYKVENIKERTFANCNNLETVIFCGKIKNIEKDAFSGSYRVRNVFFAGDEAQLDSVIIDSSNYDWLSSDTFSAFDPYNIMCYATEEDGKIVYEANIYSEANIPAVFMIAAYDNDGRMYGIDIQNVNYDDYDEGGAATVNGSFMPYSIGAEYCRVFFWYDLTGKPVYTSFPWPQIVNID